MIKKDKFIAFLKYIGITNERHHARLYITYQRFYRKSIGSRKNNVINENYKKYTISKFKDFMSLLDYEEGTQDMITEYIIYPNKRMKLDIEVDKYGSKGVWAKC